MGIVKDEQDRWYRIRQDERLPAGWQVLTFNETEMIVGLGEGCEPKAWRWQREGTKMKRLRRIILLMMLSMPTWAAVPKPVTLAVDEVPVVQILQSLVDLEGRNLIVAPDVKGVLSLHLTHVPWRQALHIVVASAGLVLREEGGILYVNTASGQREQQARKEEELAQQKLNVPSPRARSL